MSLARNERLKLFATYLNGLAIATFAVGGLAPSLAIFTGTISEDRAGAAFAVAVVCLIVSIALHYAGSLTLKRLRP